MIVAYITAAFDACQDWSNPESILGCMEEIIGKYFFINSIHINIIPSYVYIAPPLHLLYAIYVYIFTALALK